MSEQLPMLPGGMNTQQTQQLRAELRESVRRSQEASRQAHLALLDRFTGLVPPEIGLAFQFRPQHAVLLTLGTTRALALTMNSKGDLKIERREGPLSLDTVHWVEQQFAPTVALAIAERMLRP